MRALLVLVAVLCLGAPADAKRHRKHPARKHGRAVAAHRVPPAVRSAPVRRDDEAARADAELAELRGRPQPAAPAARGPMVAQEDDKEVPGTRAVR